MIQFFRRLRQSFIADNKVSKYLLYAFGEIILVVIGILIALQVNNWNEKRKATIRSSEYLEEILLDLTADTLELNDKIKWVGDELKEMEWYLSRTSFDERHIDSLKLAAYSYYPDFHIHDATFQRIQNSGDTHLSGYDKITKAINRYYNQINTRAIKNNDFLMSRVSQWYDYADAYLKDIEQVNQDFVLLNNPEFQIATINDPEANNQLLLTRLKAVEFRNYVTDRYFSFDFLLDSFKNFNEEAKGLINEINKSLHKTHD